MKQKVHSVSYLAKAEFEFKNGVYDLVALPAGAEVVKVSLEMASSLLDGSIHIGFKDETNKNYFLTLERVAGGNEGGGAITSTSDKDYTATSNKVIVAEVKRGNKEDHVKCILRVVYFLPSVIEVEY